MGRKNSLVLAAAGIGAGMVIRAIVRKRAEMDLFGKVVLITGGSRGLGLALAREFAAEGCRVAICARDTVELERARQDLASGGAQVFAVRCDITDRAQVDGMIGATVDHYGSLDVLVNNAGEIQVGPIESMTLEDFEQAMDVMFWGTVYPTIAVLPDMLERRSGRIVNITSIGGKVAVPHLLPYDCARFAAVGFSEGLRAEVAEDGVGVVTVAPGPITISATRAARQIVGATRSGDAERILTVSAKVLARLHGLFPGATTEVLGLVDRLILPTHTNGTKARRDAETGALRSPLMSALTVLGRIAAKRYLQS